jgi:hypothetical protein
MPCAHLAAVGVTVLTLFPLVPAWMICLPWVGVCFWVLERWPSGLALLVLMMFGLSGRSEAHLLLQERSLGWAGMGAEYVHGFSLVLGVYVFGLQGLLFGPMLVYGANLVADLGKEHLREDGDELRGSPASGGAPASAGLGAEAATAGGEPARPRPVRVSDGSDLADGPPPTPSFFSRGPADVLRTMRRISFGMTPSRSGAGRTPTPASAAGVGGGRPPARWGSAAMADGGGLLSPGPTAAAAHAPRAEGGVSFTVGVRGGDAAQRVRVTSGGLGVWSVCVSRVEQRLQQAGVRRRPVARRGGTKWLGEMHSARRALFTDAPCGLRAPGAPRRRRLAHCDG